MAKYAVSPLAPKGGFPSLPEIDGVRFSAVEAGIKYTGRLDVMLADVCAGSSVAGVFTKSATRSGPVLWSQDCLATTDTSGKGYAVVVNSGNANAFTGNAGMDGARKTARSAGDALGIPETHVFLASTGVIGEVLPADKITSRMEELVTGLDPAKGEMAARAIMTTDTFPKGSTRQLEIDGKAVTISGFAKGSGMIAPDMATMLVYIFTDAPVPQDVLQGLLSTHNETSFNCITVDSDTSTSDTLMLFATGKADIAPLTVGDPRTEVFSAALREVMLDLAHQVVRDGEGATKFVEIAINGGASDASAKTIGLAIANSPLVKTAIAGEDPNWGRIVMAIGKAGEPADRDRISIWFGDILVAENGWVSPSYTEDDGAAYMKGQDLRIAVDLGVGSGQAIVWTCDLTHQYITINADYRS